MGDWFRLVGAVKWEAREDVIVAYRVDTHGACPLQLQLLLCMYLYGGTVNNVRVQRGPSALDSKGRAEEDRTPQVPTLLWRSAGMSKCLDHYVPLFKT